MGDAGGDEKVSFAVSRADGSMAEQRGRQRQRESAEQHVEHVGRRVLRGRALLLLPLHTAD